MAKELNFIHIYHIYNIKTSSFTLFFNKLYCIKKMEEQSQIYFLPQIENLQFWKEL